MPELLWTGKRHVLDPAGGLPAHPLRLARDSSIGEESGNVIVHGDNLLALKSLLPRYCNRVKLVFIDPPYNADGEAWFYGDDIPGLEEWRGEVPEDDPLRRDKWLSMMYPRLALLRELLREDGAIFISIGDNSVHHLRALLDEIFGYRNFLACAVWHNGSSAHTRPGLLKGAHNYIVAYAKDRSSFQTGNVSSPLTTWWTEETFGDSETARRELSAIFPEKPELFAIPKPTLLVRRILQLATAPDSDDVVLDCFAGSGTTAHAVLEQNAEDGGERRFILIEMADFADTLTAERVRRVIRNTRHPIPASGFDYYELVLEG